MRSRAGGGEKIRDRHWDWAFDSAAEGFGGEAGVGGGGEQGGDDKGTDGWKTVVVAGVGGNGTGTVDKGLPTRRPSENQQKFLCLPHQ